MPLKYGQSPEGRYAWITDEPFEKYLLTMPERDRIRTLQDLCSNPSGEVFASTRISGLGQTVYIAVNPVLEARALEMYDTLLK